MLYDLTPKWARVPTLWDLLNSKYGNDESYAIQYHTEPDGRVGITVAAKGKAMDAIKEALAAINSK